MRPRNIDRGSRKVRQDGKVCCQGSYHSAQLELALGGTHQRQENTHFWVIHARSEGAGSLYASFCHSFEGCLRGTGSLASLVCHAAYRVDLEVGESLELEKTSVWRMLKRQGLSIWGRHP